ncbi:hypothetical protein [Reichenbachiella sp. MSK19-1]|nr:hypothetical protein [Reichenbachiella sp. MSK19-1]
MMKPLLKTLAPHQKITAPLKGATVLQVWRRESTGLLSDQY